jgi:hypothetical protein
LAAGGFVAGAQDIELGVALLIPVMFPFGMVQIAIVLQVELFPKELPAPEAYPWS